MRKIKFIATLGLAALAMAQAPRAQEIPAGQTVPSGQTLYPCNRNYLNGLIDQSSLALGALDPSPYWLNLNAPYAGGLLAAGTNYSFQIGANTVPYSPFLSVDADPSEQLVVYKGAGPCADLLKLIQPPYNNGQDLAFDIPFAVDTNGGSISLLSAFNSYNLMAYDSDQFGHSVWYKLELPQDGRVWLNNGTASTLWLASSTGATSTMTVAPGQRGYQDVTAGSHYLVQGGNQSAGQIQMLFQTQPANDNFANATLLDSWTRNDYINGTFYNLNYSFKTDGGSREPGEPPTDGDYTVWFKIVPPQSGKLVIGVNNYYFGTHIYRGSSLGNLTLVSAAGQSIDVTAGETLWIQHDHQAQSVFNPVAGPQANLYPASLQLISIPSNDNFLNAISVLTNNTVRQVALNGTNYYAYDFTVPNGFWPLSPATHIGENYYIRNWYQIHADNLVNVLENDQVTDPWETIMDGRPQPILSVGGSGGQSRPSTYNDIKEPTEWVANRLYVQSWASEPSPVGDANYGQNLTQPFTSGNGSFWGSSADEIGALALTNTLGLQSVQNDSHYAGLFDGGSAFTAGPGISYLYGVPGSFLMPDDLTSYLGSLRHKSYTFLATQPTPIILRPLFPVGTAAAGAAVDATAQKQTQTLLAYTHESSLENAEPPKAGTGGGSVWWKTVMPYTGYLHGYIRQGDPPVVYVWVGDTLETLQAVTNNYVAGTPRNEFAAKLNQGDHVCISTDRGVAPSIFQLELNFEPLPLNQASDYAQPVPLLVQRDFENGTNWLYRTDYTLYPNADGQASNLWFTLQAPANAMATFNTTAGANNTARIYSPKQTDMQLQPPGGDFIGALDLQVTSNPLLGPISVYYTLDGTTPAENSAPYAASIHLTNSAMVTVAGYRAGHSIQYQTQSYTIRDGLHLAVNGDLNNLNGQTTFTLQNNAADGATVLYRFSSGDWQSYTNPVSLNGIGSGDEYLYYTKVVGGRTNPIQIASIRFHTPAPIVAPQSGDVPGPITVTVTPATAGDLIYYNLGPDDGSAAGTNYSAGATLTLPGPTLNLPGGSHDVVFFAQRSGYLMSPAVEVRYTGTLQSPAVQAVSQNGSAFLQITPALNRGTIIVQGPAGTDYFDWKGAWQLRGTGSASPTILAPAGTAGSYQVQQTSPDWNDSDPVTIAISAP
jgi:hypothetical protein